MPDEPTLRDRAREAILSRRHGDKPESLLKYVIDGAQADADAVMDVVAPELERRDERIKELEAAHLATEIARVEARAEAEQLVTVARSYRAERDEARAEVERLRQAAAEAGVWLDRIERDRTERDKVLAQVRSCRHVLSAASGNTETGTKDERPCPVCGGDGVDPEQRSVQDDAGVSPECPGCKGRGYTETEEGR